MTRRSWLLLALAVILVVVAYGGYDWTRPCAGGPLRQAVTSLVEGGAYTVRCAG